jgi:hypothetical protein
MDDAHAQFIQVIQKRHLQAFLLRVVVFVTHNLLPHKQKLVDRSGFARSTAANPTATNLADTLIALQIQCGSAFFSAVAATRQQMVPARRQA